LLFQQKNKHEEAENKISIECIVSKCYQCYLLDSRWPHQQETSSLKGTPQSTHNSFLSFCQKYLISLLLMSNWTIGGIDTSLSHNPGLLCQSYGRHCPSMMTLVLRVDAEQNGKSMMLCRNTNYTPENLCHLFWNYPKNTPKVLPNTEIPKYPRLLPSGHYSLLHTHT
jgi:hypothetical protein